MKVFYHAVDLDGHCSGALVKMRYPKCELFGIDYGDLFPWTNIEPSEEIFMVDFSLQPFSKMAQLVNTFPGNLIWIDHHKSAIEEYEVWNKAHMLNPLPPIDGKRKIGKGACELVWEYLSPEMENTPTFIKLLSEYDVWNHSDPRTLSFQYGIRQYDTYPENQDFWKELFDLERVQQIVEEGSIILKYITSENKKYVDACSFETELDGLKCIAVNKMLTNSQLFDSVWDEAKYDAMLTFGYKKGQWTVSLYSTKDDIDVSVIAKNLAYRYGISGGGGHKKAAGCQVNSINFIFTNAKQRKKTKYVKQSRRVI